MCAAERSMVPGVVFINLPSGKKTKEEADTSKQGMDTDTGELNRWVQHRAGGRNG